MKDEIELMTKEQIDASLELWAIYQERRERREKIGRWMRSWGTAILAGVLIGEVAALGMIAGAF